MAEPVHDDRIDIHDPVTEICRRLGLTPKNVRQLTLTHKTAVATTYRLNDHGAKHIDDTGTVPTDTLEFDVTT